MGTGPFRINIDFTDKHEGYTGHPLTILAGLNLGLLIPVLNGFRCSIEGVSLILYNIHTYTQTLHVLWV